MLTQMTLIISVLEKRRQSQKVMYHMVFSMSTETECTAVVAQS